MVFKSRSWPFWGHVGILGVLGYYSLLVLVVSYYIHPEGSLLVLSEVCSFDIGLLSPTTYPCSRILVLPQNLLLKLLFGQLVTINNNLSLKICFKILWNCFRHNLLYMYILNYFIILLDVCVFYDTQFKTIYNKKNKK